MSRNVVDLEEELNKIWSLVSELTEQLNSNRALVDQLKSRSENVKGQAAHAGAGFPLRRFNLDISDEEFQGELEAFSSHLVLENQQLQSENKQLNALLKEYEGTLETVMGKFRGVAHASQQHDLSLHSYYTSLLQTLQTAHSSAQLHDDTSLSLLLTRLSTLLRSALRSLGGEDASELEQSLNHLLLPNRGPSSDNSSEPPSSPSSSKSKPRLNPFPFQYAPAGTKSRINQFPMSSGGYAGTDGQTDWAMEREMEIMRLEDENKALREMLAIAEELSNTGVEEVEVEKEEETGDEGEPRGGISRKNSLTVDELQAGAEEEEEKRASSGLSTLRGELSGMEEIRLEDAVEGTGKENVEEKKVATRESILGFSTDVPPPEEAIEESAE